jgi:alkylation response protein AidB-like acyl-CoA dehydrogenase
VYLDYTPGEKALRADLRRLLAGLVTPEVLAETRGGEGGGPRYRDVMRALGAGGWLGLGWPEEAGGQGRPPIEQYIFFDEVQRTDFPIPFLTLCTVGPMIWKHGTDEQKASFLPRILAGEIEVAIGYTEPGAGTDLASLTTRAVRDGDVYVVNGQKVFTSGADHAAYVWLAARTDPEAPRHQGISILLLDTRLPGFSVTPIHTLAGTHTTATFYEDVRVPVAMRVGREHEGWRLITGQLNHERVALSAPGAAARAVEEVTAWAREPHLAGGRRAIDLPWVQLDLARAHALLEALTLMAWRQAWRAGRGEAFAAESSAVKVLGSESFVTIYRLLLGVLGEAGAVRAGSPGAALAGRLEMFYRAALVFTFGGGTNEVQRDLIATLGLKMPRSR